MSLPGQMVRSGRALGSDGGRGRRWTWRGLLPPLPRPVPANTAANAATSAAQNATAPAQNSPAPRSQGP